MSVKHILYLYFLFFIIHNGPILSIGRDNNIFVRCVDMLEDEIENDLKIKEDIFNSEYCTEDSIETMNYRK